MDEPDGAFEWAKEAVHIESKMHDAIKIMASIEVNRFKTSAVDVPKRDSPASPPKEAPKPEPLLSWIKIVPQSKMHSNKKRAIAKK